MSFCRRSGHAMAGIPVVLLTLSLLMLWPARALAAVAALSDYMSCARSVGVAIHERFAILPGDRSGLRGLYVYTDQAAFFLPLGAPQAVDGDAQEFLLRTRLADIGDIYLGYRDGRPGSRTNVPPGISYQTDVREMSGLSLYRPTIAAEATDARALDVLRQRLREKVATIKDFIDEKNRYSSPADAKAAFERDRMEFLSRLAVCRIEGDRQLNLVVADEMQKLETGFPGATVWEKQIGGKSQPVTAR